MQPWFSARMHRTTGGAAALPALGISSICNLLAGIKTARYYDMDENDCIFTVFTDSVDMYRSRLAELTAEHGAYSSVEAARDHAGPIAHQGIDHFKELTYQDRKAVHNLKYYTWVEQQGKTSDELNAQWDPAFWTGIFEEEAGRCDRMIQEFNSMSGA